MWRVVETLNRSEPSSISFVLGSEQVTHYSGARPYSYLYNHFSVAKLDVIRIKFKLVRTWAEIYQGTKHHRNWREKVVAWMLSTRIQSRQMDRRTETLRSVQIIIIINNKIQILPYCRIIISDMQTDRQIDKFKPI